MFYFIHGYQFEVLSWSLYKSLALYENFCEDMCLIGEEGSRFADNLWKFYLEKITRAVKSPGSLKGFRTDKFEIYKLKELERDFESREISSHITPLTLTEEISCKSRELLSQIESTEKEQKLSGLSPEESYAIIKEIRK